AALARYPQLTIAAVNGPDSCVVSGPAEKPPPPPQPPPAVGVGMRRFRGASTAGSIANATFGAPM
uniref:hypothetical protein n=1 Tax=Nocardia cyriacigeorgica TaxID=135487 RepID=UPI0024543FA1